MKLQRTAGLLLMTALALFTQSTPAPRPTGYIVRPTGRSTALQGFGMSAAVTPDGQHLLVIATRDTGATLTVFDAKTERVLSSETLPGAWGLALSPNGRLVYVSAGATATIFEYRLTPEGKLEAARNFPVAADPKQDQLIGDLALTPDGRMVYAADLLHDQVLVVNLSSGRVIERFASVRRPAKIRFHPNGETYFVASWADGSLAQYRTINGERFNTVGVGPHLTDIAWRDKKTQLEEGEETPELSGLQARMFVPAANSNTVYTVGVAASNDTRVIDRTPIPLFRGQPVGMTPSAVALSPNQDRLYVACSDANALAVLDVTGPRAILLGFIPADEYPTAVRTLADGRIVVVHGGASGGDGTLLFLNPPPDEALALQTGIVFANTPLKDQDPRQRPIAMNPVPFTPGEPTQITNVVYILREGRSHKALGERLAPNQFKIAREFTELTGFQPIATTPQEGYYWATAAIVPDIVRKMVPAQRSGQPEISELDFAAQPAAGYLWNQTAARLYGITELRRTPRGPLVVPPDLNQDFAAPDRAIADTARAQAFLTELARYEQGNNLPRLMMLRLAGDRPSPPGAARKGVRTNDAAAADSDYALGLILERLSHSKYWPKMAVFVVNTYSDSQSGDNGPSALIASPFATRGKPVAGPFSTLSALRTMEHILNLAPMTTFDAAAPTLEPAFQSTPDLRPYDAERPRVATEMVVQ